MDYASVANVPEAVRKRADAAYDEMQYDIVSRTDRLFALIMVLQWIFGIICALVVSPRAWAGSVSEVHIHVWAAVFLGGILTLFPAAFGFFRPGRTSTRYIIAAGQMFFGALLIHLTAGRIETHFHIFGSLAFLAFYRDWRVLVLASVIVAFDHFARGIFWPQSVYGVTSIDQWRWLEHTGWVVFEDVFLVYSCIAGVGNLKSIALRRAVLEENNIKMQELRTAADQANQAKSSFLANMSHEIRTPLGAIMGFTQLLTENDLNTAEKKHFLEVITRNGQSLIRIIDDILDLSKVEAGAMEVEKIRFSLPTLLKDVNESLRNKAAKKNIRINIFCDQDCPEYVHSDPTRLRQVLLNIIGNALKFTERGNIRVTVTSEAFGDNFKLLFSVEDSGRGLSRSEQERLFKPFTQADSSTTRKYGGTGLGLMLSRKIARQLGGDVALVKSAPGEGSTFSIVIIAGKDAPDSEKDVSQLKATVMPADSKRLDDLDILLVEDMHDNRLLIQRLLSGLGAHVSIAENGAEALIKIGQKKFDVVLMDMQMPIMDGIAATTELRRRGHREVIIALTAHAMLEDRSKCLSAGCDDYVTKPVDLIELVRTINARLMQKQASSATIL